ncbi:MAG: glycoside hydrolase family 43 protein, partial [Verrucomicrobiales bacterium]|nr:glycoside hydrolase family 43 protein [Verrucomicrobiales bacterium]
MLRRHLVAWVIAVFGTGTAAAAAAGAIGEGREARTFTNPIVAKGADPWVVRWEGAWYRAHSGGGAVSVSRFEALEEMGKAEARRVWVPEPGREYSRNLWAPEIHHLDGRWHLYVAADDGRNENHRMYVLEGDARDPQAPYLWRGRMAARTDRWAIDGTILSLPDGRRYFVWSGWEGTENVAQHLYLARLSSAVSIDGERVRISTPEHPWERHGQPWVNEGPQVLWRGDRLFLVYSASGSWTDDYCLGVLEWTGGDPME